MNMLPKLYLHFWWPFYGYFGSQKQIKLHQNSEFLRFTLRFVLFYMSFLVLWKYVHLYYEAPLFYLTTKACNFILNLPLEQPELSSDGRLCIRLCDFIYYPKLQWYTVSTLTVLPLLFATSSIRWLSRIKMVFTAIWLLSIYQVLYIIVDIYAWLFRNYQSWIKKGVNAYQIIEYNQKFADFFFSSVYYLMIFQGVIIIGLWIGLVYFYKKRSIKKMPWVLL